MDQLPIMDAFLLAGLRRPYDMHRADPYGHSIWAARHRRISPFHYPIESVGDTSEAIMVLRQ